jgi:ribosomal protein S14
MKKRIKYNMLNKVIRIAYIKTELSQLVKTIILTSQSTTTKERVGNVGNEFHTVGIRRSRSNQRLFCSITSSSKIVTRKFKLGRFVFSSLSNAGKIGGLYKRGW